MAKRDGGAGAKKTAGKRYSFTRETNSEADPEWREIFQRVARLRAEKAAPHNKKLVFSRIDKEGGGKLVIRRQADPEPVRTFLKSEGKKAGRGIAEDFDLIREAWRHAVGEEIASHSSVHSFKNGVLCIDVNSSALLQEIRLFHKEAIFKDLFDIWSASIPLIKITYRQGKR